MGHSHSATSTISAGEATALHRTAASPWMGMELCSAQPQWAAARIRASYLKSPRKLRPEHWCLLLLTEAGFDPLMTCPPRFLGSGERTREEQSSKCSDRLMRTVEGE